MTASTGGVAPWAQSPTARERLAAVEAALPGDLAAALDQAAAAAREHARRVDEDVLLLYAGGNVPVPRSQVEAWTMDAGVARLLAGQPSMGYPGDKYQAGIEPLDVVEVAVTRGAARLFGARFADLRPTSATLANLAVYSALAQPGDTIAVLPDWAGGHLSHHAIGAAGVRGLRIAELPYDAYRLDVDLALLPEFLARERPVVVVVGASLMLRAARVRAIAEQVHRAGATLLYDASHVAGLIAEGRFQAPLDEGADVMTFSTYKSFGGPAGGAIVSSDEALMARVTTAVYPGLTANYDISRLLPLGAAVLAHERSGGAYADACIANAKALAHGLARAGYPVLGGAPDFTSSHHVAVDVRDLGGGTAAARRLAEANILLSEIGCPAPDGRHDPAGAIRIGTQTLTRQGFTVDDMASVAAAVAVGLDADADLAIVRDKVRETRRRHLPG